MQGFEPFVEDIHADGPEVGVGHRTSTVAAGRTVKCNLVHLVWIDGAYDMVRFQERAKYGRDSGAEIGPVDVVRFAEAFGATGLRIEGPDQITPTPEEGLRGARSSRCGSAGGLPRQPPTHGDCSPGHLELRSRRESRLTHGPFDCRISIHQKSIRTIIIDYTRHTSEYMYRMATFSKSLDTAGSFMPFSMAGQFLWP